MITALCYHINLMHFELPAGDAVMPSQTEVTTRSNIHISIIFDTAHGFTLHTQNSKDRSQYVQKSSHSDGKIPWDSMTHP